MEILIIIFLILLNGVFSMSEIAMVSVNKFKLEAAARRGNKNAGKALNLSENPNTFLSTVQIGITLIGILTGIFSGQRLTEDLKNLLLNVSFLQPYADTIALALIVAIITFCSIVFGELIPKRIGLRFPEAIASLMAGPMNWLSALAKPFIWLLGKTNDLFLGLFGIKDIKEKGASEEEITAMIHESTLSGNIQEIEQDIVKRVFALGDRKVRELMTHRTHLVWFDVHDDLDTVKKKTESENHSVYPVGDKSLDKLMGLVYIKDFFLNAPDRNNFRISDYCRKPLFVHENTPAYQALELFKSKRIHYAMVVDEYGSIEGLITMNDVLDALVGDTPEDNQEEFLIVQRNENSWLADGQYPYFEFLQYFGIDEEPEGGFSTLAGLVLNRLHHIPVTGERMRWQNFEFEIVDMDEQRIDKILITRLTEPPPEI